MTYDCDQGTKQHNLSAVAVKKEHENLIVGHVQYIIASVSDWW